MNKTFFTFRETVLATQADGVTEPIHTHACYFTVLVRTGGSVGGGVAFGRFIITSLSLVGDHEMVDVVYFDKSESRAYTTLRRKDLNLAGLFAEDPDFIGDLAPQFGKIGEIGDPLIVPNHTRCDWGLSIGETMYLTNLSDRFAEKESIDTDHPRGFTGSPVFNINKELVAVSLGSKPKTNLIRATPAYLVAEMVNQLSRNHHNG